MSEGGVKRCLSKLVLYFVKAIVGLENKSLLYNHKNNLCCINMQFN